MACWITTAAMIVSWKDQTKTTPRDLAIRLGEPWLTLFTKDEGLPRERYFDFFEAAGFRFEWPANHLPGAYMGFLQKYGPLWITTSDSASSHARLLIGMSEKGGKVTMVFIDPATGREEHQEFAQFFDEFEREARLLVAERPNLDLPIQVVHLPKKVE